MFGPSAKFRSVLLLSVFAVLGACERRRAWHEAGWRPSTPPQRVVLGSVLAAEELLGVLPRQRIAGVHAFAADAGYSLVAAQCGDLMRLGASPEQLLAARPDLVLVDAYTRGETLALLSAADVPVLRTRDPHGVDDIVANLRLLGRATHCEAGCEDLIEQLHEGLHEVRERGRDLSEWRLMSLDGALHTYGRGSLFDLIASVAGAQNVAATRGVGLFRKLDIEELLAWQPHALVLSAGVHGDGGANDVPDWIAQYPGLDLLECVRKRRLLFVPAPLLSTTSHHIVDVAAHVQRQLLEWGQP